MGADGPTERPYSAAREYRRARARRRGPYEFAVGFLVLVGVIVSVVYYATNLPSTSPALSASTSSRGGAGGIPQYILFGPPSLRNVTCGDGRNFEAEVVPWVAARISIQTDDIFLELTELIDGDIDGGPTPTPAVTASSVCAGAPPHVSPSWYIVLQSPAGVNLAWYSYSQGWVVLGSSTVTSIPIANDSSLVLLSVPSVWGLSFGMCALGDVGSADIDSCAPL